MTDRKYVMCALAMIALVPALNASAQEFPVRPVRLVVPLTAASGADIAGRIVGRQLQEIWKQPVLIACGPK